MIVLNITISKFAVFWHLPNLLCNLSKTATEQTFLDTSPS